jgi:hypothetical protein
LGLSQPPVTDYPLWVGDAQVTSANATNLTGGETVAASYDATTNTLTLNGASITTGHDVSTYYPGTGDTVVDTYSIYFSGSDALNIVLNGTNSVKSPEFDNAIHSENANADINISGNGSLTLECDNSGIRVVVGSRLTAQL